MNIKREPAHLADDYCDEHGLDRVDPDDVTVLDAFLDWITQTGRTEVWQQCLDLYDYCPSLELAHSAFHEITGGQGCSHTHCFEHGNALVDGRCKRCSEEAQDRVLDSLYRRRHLTVIDGGGA